jgi:hypothetical protein
MGYSTSIAIPSRIGVVQYVLPLDVESRLNGIACNPAVGAVSVAMPQALALGSGIGGTAKAVAKCFALTGAACVE